MVMVLLKQGLMTCVHKFMVEISALIWVSGREMWNGAGLGCAHGR